MKNGFVTDLLDIVMNDISIVMIVMIKHVLKIKIDLDIADLDVRCLTKC